MPGIRFDYFTKEVEMKGSESFIDSNFDTIRDLWIESFGAEKTMLSRRRDQETMPSEEIKRNAADAETVSCPPCQASQRVPTASASEISRGGGVKRPPLRKYIRKEGLPGQQRIVVEVAETEKPKEISLASLREKFGLTESKIGGIVRDAEKEGKVKRVIGGAYSWR